MIVLIYFLIIFLGIGLQSLVRYVVDQMNKRIKISMDEVRKFADEESKPELNKEINSFNLIDKKKEKLSFITKIFGCFEIILFGGLMFLLLNEGKSYLIISQTLGVATSSWLALKIFGNYQQWSGPVFGRATFYVFLLGSLLNIIGAIILGRITFEILF